jgi:hypothetical protein
MSTKGSKVERHSVSDQPHELRYEAQKKNVSAQAIKDIKKSAGNQRAEIEKKLNK